MLCDSTKPVITFMADITADTKNDVVVTCRVTDNLSGTVTLTESKTGSATFADGSRDKDFTTTYTFDANGSVTVTATDLCGNTETKTFTVGNVDKSKPILGLTAETKGAPMAANTQSTAHIDFTLSYKEEGIAGMDEMKYQITGNDTRPTSGWETADETSPTETIVSLSRAAIGVYYVHMYAKDKVGNDVYQCFGPYEIINTAPKAENFPLSVKEGESIAITLRGRDDDEGDQVESYRIDDTLLQHGTLEQALDPESGLPIFGKYIYTHDGLDPISDTSFTYFAKDSRSEESAEATVTIHVIEVNDPPVITPEEQTDPWGTDTSKTYTFDVSDVDDLFKDLRISVRSSDGTLLPPSSVVLTKTVDTVDPHKGTVTLKISPNLYLVTEDKTAVITITVRDAAGANDSGTLTLEFEPLPSPPIAENQYFYLKADNSVSGEVGARLGHRGESLTYSFDDSEVSKGNFSGDPSDGTFTYTAGASFDGDDIDTVKVTITQANDDGPDLTTVVYLWFCGEVRTPEADISDREVKIVPGIGSSNPGAYTIESSAPGIIAANNCRVTVENNTLVLEYLRSPYRYGELEITLHGPDGDIVLPFVVEPINNAPDVVMTAKSEKIISLFSPFSSLLGAGQFLAVSEAPITFNDQKQSVSMEIYAGSDLSGTLAPTDAKDNRPPNNGGKYDRSYQCEVFDHQTWLEPENGTLEMTATGFLYTPDEDFLGNDTFSILVGENEGFSENQNPLRLSGGVLDLTADPDEPLLGRVITVNVKVKEAPVVTGGGSGGTGGSGSGSNSGGNGNPGQSIFASEHEAYLIGYPDGTVRPEKNLRRSEVATVVFRLLRDEVRNSNWTQTNGFSDVNSGQWFNNAVSVMSKMEVLNGYPDGSFQPNGNITRGELAAVAARFGRQLGTKEVRTPFFNDTAGHWAQQDIGYAAAIGFFDGYPDGSFRPDTYVTRAEFVALVNRMTGRLPETMEDILPDNMNTWTDNADPSAWYYLDMQEATNSHGFMHKDSRHPERDIPYGTWLELYETRDWASLEQSWAEANSN